jgi:hypothetical protein
MQVVRTVSSLNALSMWKSHQTAGDYHHNMNQKWVEKKLVPNLPAESVVVIDNAPYHNVKINRNLTPSCNKKEMQQRL